MLRKFIITLVATTAIGAVAIPTSAFAYWHGHGGWYGGWRGPGWGYRPYAYGVRPYDTCYRTARRVGTPYGWRWRSVWVCR